MGDERLGRREFLRLAAAGAVGAAVTGTGCSAGAGDDKAKAKGNSAESPKNGAAPKQLRIVTVNHFVPGYDDWLDSEYAPTWGERNGVQVIVDHIPVGELTARAAGEVTTRRGHDLFGFVGPPPAAFEDDVIDHREVIEEIQAKVGKPHPLTERSTFNPRTNKWFGVSDYWTPQLISYRTDFWAGLGTGGRPDTWDDLLKAGPKLKAAGHPLGLDMSLDLDGNQNLAALLYAYGASVQNEDGVLALNSRATVEAVKVGSTLWAGAQSADTLSWNDPAANNRHMAGGKGSLILNPISALRAVEKQDPVMARNIALAPPLAGPAARVAPATANSVYVVWNFAENQETAKRFLVDLVAASRDGFIRSEFYNFPAFPGSVPDLRDLVVNPAGVEPAGKYALIAQAPDWSTNTGHPGYANAAIDEVFSQYLIPKMFAAAAQGEVTAEEAVKAADAQIKPIYDRWRERGKI